MRSEYKIFVGELEGENTWKS